MTISKNLGLLETVARARNALDKRVGGDIHGQIAVKGDKRLGYYITDEDGRIRAAIYKDKGGNLILTNGYDGGGMFIIRCDGAVSFGNASAAITGDGNIYGNAWSISGGAQGYLYDYLDHLFPVGVPMPYSRRYTPVGYFTCNGQIFDKSRYPKLAEAYPSGTVPDLRGEFIRGWDNNRGVDPGRMCGTWQADAMQGHTHRAWPNATAASASDSPLQHGGPEFTGRITQTHVVSSPINDGTNGEPRIANETRPRNIAFNYIVRAV